MELINLRQSRNDTRNMDHTDVGKIKNICFIGAGHVGTPTATVLAFFHPHIRITVVDHSKSQIQRWNSQSRHFPIQDEEYLAKLVRATRDGLLPADQGGPHRLSSPAREPNLAFSTDVQGAIVEADMVFICVGTPSGGENNMDLDTGAVESAVRDVLEYGKEGVIVVVKSTVPVGTAAMAARMITLARPAMSFEVLSNPEFLAEGAAVKNLIHPDRILIGSAKTGTGHAAASRLAALYSAWIDPAKIQRMSTSSAELAKFAANAMLAQRIGLINAISAICHRTGGAEIGDIERALGTDPRIGSEYLRAGIGFGGSCLRKDILSLFCLSESLGLPTVAECWKQIVRMNDYQCDDFVQRVASAFGGSLSDRKIAIFGWAFKKGVSDSRVSRSVDVFKALLEESVAEVAVFDPACDPADVQEELYQILESKPREDSRPGVSTVAAEDPYEACHLADAILILTDWDHFRCPPASPTAVTSGGAAPSGDTYSSSSPISQAECALSDVGPPAWKLSFDQDSRISDHDMAFLRNPATLLKPEPERRSECTESCWKRRPNWGESHGQVDWGRIVTAMKHPWVFDGRNMVDVEEMERLGFRTETIGKARVEKPSEELGIEEARLCQIDGHQIALGN